MSELGVTALDHTVQETNIWLKAIELTSRIEAEPVRLFADIVEDWAAKQPEQPALISDRETLSYRQLAARINQYARWALANDRHLEYFVDDIFRQLPPHFPVDPLTAARGIFEILWEKLDPGEFDKLMAHLPVSLRNLREPAT